MLTSNFTICTSVLWYLIISVTELHFRLNRIGGVMLSVLASSVVYRGFKSRSGQTKNYEISMYCFSAKHAALRNKSEERRARNQNDMSEWSDIFTRGLSFQWIRAITKLPNSEKSYKGKVKTHNYINTKSVNNRKTVKTVMTLTWYRHF